MRAITKSHVNTYNVEDLRIIEIFSLSFDAMKCEKFFSDLLSMLDKLHIHCTKTTDVFTSSPFCLKIKILKSLNK